MSIISNKIKERQNMSLNEIIKNEIDALPESILAEILEFIHFLEFKKEKKMLTRAAQDLSGASFQKVWDNPADVVYDRL
ncbi:toxin-antitoxin system, antitoxin component, Xre family protein [candidate division KSB1 bacterium]|nr:toxin-antitoxin system, antitoxin component, Xre family protein [candidate division KSB1 bacterium]